MELHEKIGTLVLDEITPNLVAIIRSEIRNLTSVENQNKSGTEILQINDLCALLKVTRQTLHAWRKSGKIPFRRVGSRIFFLKDEVLNSLKKIQPGKEVSG